MKLIEFKRLLFALSCFLKESRLEQDLMSSGRKFQDNAARCLKEDLPTSVLGLSTSKFSGAIAQIDNMEVCACTSKRLPSARFFPIYMTLTMKFFGQI